MNIPVNPRGTVDLDIDNNTVHLERAPLLSVGSAAQEVSKIKPLPHKDTKAWPKPVAETGLTK